ncbi:MAG: site-2 protease family protein [Candidatus Woesearchaeota archaeon]|nr:MAG: site-2 protease family protein [Candidatus Woesearchaeota archaeon]
MAINYDLTLAIVFYAIVIIFFYLNRKNVQIQGWILFIYRTKLGLKLMDKLSKFFPKLLHSIGLFGIFTGFLAMFGLFAFLVYQTALLFFRPETPAALAPLLPGVKIPGLPVLPFWYFIIGIFITVVLHEFAHGVYARLYNIKMKSSGLAFFGPLPAAFVEPDEKEMNKVSVQKQLSILTMGSFTNLILAVAFLLVGSFLIAPYANNLIADSGILVDGIQEGFPIFFSGIQSGEQIIAINGIEVRNAQEFVNLLTKTKPNEEVTIETDKRTVKVTTFAHPKGAGYGYLGLTVVPANITLWEVVVFWFLRLFFWVWVISFGIGLFNWLPFFITDGGKMFLLLSQILIKDKKKANLFWLRVNSFCLFIILAQLIAFIFKLF